MKKISLLFIFSLFLFSCDNMAFNNNKSSVLINLPSSNSRSTSSGFNNNITEDDVNYFQVELKINDKVIATQDGARGDVIAFNELNPAKYDIRVKGFSSNEDKKLLAYANIPVELNAGDEKVVPVLMKFAKITNERINSEEVKFECFYPENLSFTIGDILSEELIDFSKFGVNATFFNEDEPEFVYTLQNNIDYFFTLNPNDIISSTTEPLSFYLSEKQFEGLENYSIGEEIPLTINVMEPEITKNLSDKKIQKSELCTLDIEVTEYDDENIQVSYQWYESNDNETFNPIEDANSASLEISSDSVGKKYYKCEVTTSLKNVATGNKIGISEKTLESNVSTIQITDASLQSILVTLNEGSYLEYGVPVENQSLSIDDFDIDEIWSDESTSKATNSDYELIIDDSSEISIGDDVSVTIIKRDNPSISTTVNVPCKFKLVSPNIAKEDSDGEIKVAVYDSKDLSYTIGFDDSIASGFYDFIEQSYIWQEFNSSLNEWQDIADASDNVYTLCKTADGTFKYRIKVTTSVFEDYKDYCIGDVELIDYPDTASEYEVKVCPISVDLYNEVGEIFNNYYIQNGTYQLTPYCEADIENLKFDYSLSPQNNYITLEGSKLVIDIPEEVTTLYNIRIDVSINDSESPCIILTKQANYKVTDILATLKEGSCLEYGVSVENQSLSIDDFVITEKWSDGETETYPATNSDYELSIDELSGISIGDYVPVTIIKIDNPSISTEVNVPCEFILSNWNLILLDNNNQIELTKNESNQYDLSSDNSYTIKLKNDFNEISIPDIEINYELISSESTLSDVMLIEKNQIMFTQDFDKTKSYEGELKCSYNEDYISLSFNIPATEANLGDITIEYPSFENKELGTLGFDEELQMYVFTLKDEYKDDEIQYKWFLDGGELSFPGTPIPSEIAPTILGTLSPGEHSLVVTVYNITKSLYDLDEITIEQTGEIQIQPQ